MSMSEGDIARDEGLALVVKNAGKAWMDKAVECCMCHADAFNGRIVTGEYLRHLIEEDVGKAHSPNVYGTVVRLLLNKGVLNPTGRWVKPKDRASHSSPKPEYTLRAGVGIPRD